MSQFHLRPVAADLNSPSPSPTASTSSPDRSSPHKTSPVSSSSHYNNARLPRRPLSPSSIRDLDLTHTSDMPQRKYPAPPTGHELMAMFPPAPPETPLETRGGPTSGFFQRQERAFFAQAGKEIFRVRVEIDLPPHASDIEGAHVKPRPRDSNGIPRSWPPQLPAHPPPNATATVTTATATTVPSTSTTTTTTAAATTTTATTSSTTTMSHHSPVHAASPSVHLANPNGRSNQRGGVPVMPVPLYPVNTHSPTSQHPPNLHLSPVHQPGMTLRTPPQEPILAASQRPKTEFQPEEFDPDEAWRRPIPYAERRRAGKHTKRVIVRS